MQSSPIKLGRISQRPPPGSLAGFWTTSNEDESERLCYVQVLGGSIVDVEVSYVLSEGSVSTGTGTTGQYTIRYAHLDCLDGSGGPGAQNLAPMGLSTTALLTRVGVSPPLPGCETAELKKPVVACICPKCKH